MTANEHDPIPAIFAGLMPGEDIAGYEKLLSQPEPVPQDVAAEIVGGRDILARLTRCGLARKVPGTQTSPAGYIAAQPEAALRAALSHHRDALVRQQDAIAAGFRVLLDGFGQLTSLQAALGELSTRPGQLVQLLTDSDEIARISNNLITETDKNWMTLETVHHDLELTEDCAVDCPEELRSRITMRAVYDKAITEDPMGRKIIARCAAQGEQARVLPRLPMKLKLADTSVALLALGNTGTGGALLIRAQPPLEALRDYYESVWEQATPIGTQPRDLPGIQLSDGEKAVLKYLAEGNSDDGIARKAGMSTPTVRRHIVRIRKLLSAQNRFQAGVAAHRRGLLD
jgi:DNA-binding CsgD family transcriptional regulator